MKQKLEKDIKARYMAALESFIEKIKDDPNIIAVIINGSLAYDVVWEKSDIDMTLVVRDQLLSTESYCLVEDGILINAYLMPRSAFKRGMERNIGGTFGQSYFAKGKMVYTTDETLSEYFEDIRQIGADDIALSTFYNACELVGIYEKSQKWLKAKNDPLYAQYFLLRAAEVIARMELCLQGEPASRESIQKAVQKNPDLMKPFYQEAMSHHMSKEEIEDAIERIDRYLMEHLDTIQRPVLEFMADQTIKTGTLISKHFHMEGHFIIGIFDYLAEKGVIEKVSQMIRITPKSKLGVEELGFLYIP
ncbi:MAG: nucleotidyltransferase domain-containing protein [Clostridia bacterium]|nr:nucleotidyltransferase domain-containing protein [Clostridia bacterium]